MKKFIALLISVIMLVGVMSLTAFAAQEISLVQIGDISAPVAGKHPDYVATYGTGYNFTTEFDTYGTTYGISWLDITDNNRKMTAADVFEVGHVYRVAVMVTAAAGYSFKKENNYSTAVTAKINGQKASAYVVTGLNAGSYVGITYTFEACDYSRISSVAVTDLSVPASGEKLDYTVTPKDDSYIVSTISWRDVTANAGVSVGATAIAGHKYEVEIWLRANDSYRFKVDSEGYPDVAAKIGAYNATVIDSESEGVVVGITDSYIVPDDIKSVTVSGIDAPVTGAVPDTEATCGSGYVIKEIRWVDKTGEYKDWVSDITVFEPGRKYVVEITLETIGNYRFSTDDIGVPDVNAKINGENAIVYSDYSNTTVSIGYEFPLTEALPATIINDVQVNFIDTPATGEAADFTGLCDGEGYEITDIVWVDTTGEYADRIYDITEFGAERKYTVQITLAAKDGYLFNTDDDGVTDVTAKINGENAIVYSDYSDETVTIGYEFPATEKASPAIIDKVYVNGIDAPEFGKAPDMECTCGAEYKITEIVWVDTTGEYKDHVYGITEFEVGHKYTVQITLKVKDGYEYLSDGYYNEVTGEINMQPAIEYGTYSVTELTIGYEFPAVEAPVHTHEYKAVVTAPTCTEDGYTTYTCECGDTYKADETEAKGHSFGEWVVVKPAEIGVEGKEEKKCTVCDEVLEERAIPALKNPDVDIMLGDVNKDGKITAADARLALRISAKLETPTEYQLVAADINKDGKVTAADARKILRKSAKLE